MMKSDVSALCACTVQQLAQQLADRRLTSVQLTQAYLDAIAEKDTQIHAYLEVFAVDALQEAAHSDARRAAGQALSPLDGVPVAVKDNLVMRGRVCSCASRMLQHFRSPYTATAVAKLQAAGMPILGRLNMDEFAMGGSTEHSAFGPTKNPVDLTRVAGGSSGGSAAAVAAGMAPCALGSDTGGSVRQPAAFCGVVGVRPAYGAISRYGLVAFASSLDQVGTLTRTCGDAALLLDVLCGPDAHDMTGDPTLTHGYAARLTPPEAPTLGIPAQFFEGDIAPDVRAAVLAAAERFRRMGATLREVSVPSLALALPAYYVLSAAEAGSNLARYDGVRYGHRASKYEGLDDMYRQSRTEGFGEEVKRRILLGTFALSSGYQDDYYRSAQRVRELLAEEMAAALEGCHALLTPTAPTAAYPPGAKQGVARYADDLYTVPASLAGLPAVSLPCGATQEGLPVGMSLIGARNQLAALLALGAAYEREAAACMKW